MTQNTIKITIPIEQDSDGYPPFGAESLWAEEVSANRFVIQNIPFYASGISREDIVSADNRNGVLTFSAVVKKSENSTIRAVFFDVHKIDGFVQILKKIGCDHEWHNNLVAINVASGKNYTDLLVELIKLSEQGILDYEEATLR